MKGNGPSLLGRDWLTHIQLDWGEIRAVSVSEGHRALAWVLQKYANVFGGPGTMKHIKAHLTLSENAQPIVRRSRQVPYAIRDIVGRELDRLESTGVLKKVSHAVWAAPVVPVPKKDGSMRLCGDYKVTINPYLLVDQYPLPRPADLMACLTGGVCFSKLDLSAAYQQMELDEESKKLVTITTHQGLYEYTRLPFGVASAPAVFQRAMDSILQGIPQVICYLDDILVTGRTVEEHNAHLEEVLKRLQEHGVKLKQEKCCFSVEAVEYLGYRIDAKGVHTTDRKVQAIIDTPAPTNVTKLRSFLGMINFYAKFIPNLSSLLHPLHSLLHAGQRWKWSKECEKVFVKAKGLLMQAPVLAHYDPDRPLVLATDASAYGLGAVLSHRNQDGTEQPIAFASRTLNTSERNYSQLDKEALSLMFGVRRFHSYLYGRRFMLLTDHKPLTSILHPKQGIPPLAAARMQRWALILSSYTYDIQYRSTHAHGNADGLSRLPVQDSQPEGNVTDATAFMIGQVEALPVQASEVEAATRTDPILGKVLVYLRQGWPKKPPRVVEPYWRRQEELSTEGDCVMWGMRVCIPKVLQQKVLAELHSGHPGVVKMKALARSYFWWPELNTEIETCVRSCQACQETRNLPAKAPLHPWAWPTGPWERIHVDYAGPVQGKMLLIVVDAHSKWPEAQSMSTTTATHTIKALREMFARYGIPQQLVSDNGPQFISEQFAEFMAVNGIKHIRTAPYHPSSNGAAERLVQTIKRGIRTGLKSGISVDQALQAVLLRLRTMPHSTTGVAPSMLMFGRNIRTRLDLLRPEVCARVREKQAQQRSQHDMHSQLRELTIGQTVWARNWRAGPRWLEARVIGRSGPLSYTVKLANGECWKRHIDHLRSRDGASPGGAVEDDGSTETAIAEHPAVSTTSNAASAGPSGIPGFLQVGAPTGDTDITDHNTDTPARTIDSDSEAASDRIVNSPDHVSESTDRNDHSYDSSNRRYPLRMRQAPERLYAHMSQGQSN